MASRQASSAAVPMFHDVNPSLGEDVVSCCGHGAGFASTSAGPTLAARARYGPRVHTGGSWTAPERPRRSKRSGDIRASGEFHHVNWAWRNPVPA